VQTNATLWASKVRVILYDENRAMLRGNKEDQCRNL
jgi:hypothetical protein